MRFLVNQKHVVPTTVTCTFTAAISRMKKSPGGRPRRIAPRKFSRQEKTSTGPPQNRPAQPRMKTILIVDDRSTDRQVLVALLARGGHRLLEAESGAEAIKIARQEKPDLVIVDVLMPKMDGYEFVRKLRLDRKIGHITVAFYTAHYIKEESRKLAKACGVRHIIVKPFEAEEVLEMVNEALAMRPRASGSLTAWEIARKHLRVVTEKLTDKVCELEELNIRLQAEVSERERMVSESLLAHAEARQAREEAERANCAKDNFLAKLSHELRTPLTPVLMCVTSLEQEKSIEPEFRAQLGMIRRNVELEARLIDDLLDLTGVAHAKLRLVRSGPVDVHSLLLHTDQIVGSDAREKSIHLQFDLTANEHHVGGDAARLQQVFWNLMKNAIKFTPRGGRVAVRTLNPVPGKFVLIVEDTGAGIEPQTLPVIFRAFEQGESRDPQSARGLGLGLAISKAIVELHGGTIQAESAGQGLGATFTMELAAVLPFPIVQAAEKEVQPQTDAHRLRLLVVEDHEPTTVVLARLLRRRGHEVLTAETVKRALLLASTHSFDLVISDLGLPDGNGIELMQQLAREYGLRGIALSGYGMPDDRAKTRRAGFLAHLVKPISFDQLQCILQGITPIVESKTTAEALG
jgi:signal transduction histidine kinase